MLISGPQVITGQKTFENLTSYADIAVGGTVNSYNLFDLYKDTLLTEGDQIVLGKKTMVVSYVWLMLLKYKVIKFLNPFVLIFCYGILAMMVNILTFFIII